MGTTTSLAVRSTDYVSNGTELMDIGHPLSEVDIHKRTANGGQELDSICRKPYDITLVRSRIFYAKPALTTQGFVQAGFKHIRALSMGPPPLNW